MIIPLPFIVSLLFTITYATDFEYKIDLNRCSQDRGKEDMSCFVRQECKGATGADKDEIDQFEISGDAAPPEEVDKCDVIVQVKKMNSKKLMMLIQVKGKLNPEIGIEIFHTGTETDDDGNTATKELKSSCTKEEGVKGTSDLPGFTFGPIGKNSFASDRMFCSIIISTTSTTRPSDIGQLTAAVAELRYTSIKDDGSDVQLALKWNNPKLLWTSAPETCNFNNVKYAESEEYLLTEIDTSRSLMKCTEDNAKLLVSYTNKDGKDVNVEADEVKCDDRSQFVWTKAGQSDTMTKFLTGCIKMKYCTACPEPTTFSPEECPTCTSFITEDENGCKVRKCPEDKFTVDGKKDKTSPKGITCEKKDGGSKWRLHDTDDNDFVESHISCFIQKPPGCSPIDKLSCPTDLTNCTSPVPNEESPTQYSCSKGKILQQERKPVTLSCNTDTLQWSGFKSDIDLYCAVEEKEESSAKESDTKAAGPGMYIGIVSGIFVIAGVGAAYYFLIHKKKREAKKTTKKEEGTSKKSSKTVESKSGADGSSNEAKKEEKKSDPNKESEKPAAEAAKDAPKDGKETPADPPKETPKDAAATPAAAATPGAPPTPGTAAPPTPAAGANNKQEPPTPISNITSGPDSAPAPADATPV
ncbi:hypothetical protein PRIPAC_80120 [Pristionchus pacificus]|uniref:Uncharacterized protein n=1 Tax=Pristionchus pacificus TaxID=54126 RepID=A0A2A6CBR7_PRIPA|nr:hypothetical protein PRIPAC_80120 [Pristionchus pacificus]|eukprot:PDM75540.1 hypothetical protein PRIPAC_42717 [Pristionchus pacificus]